MKSFPPSWNVCPANTVCSEIVDCLNKTAPVVEHDTGFRMIRTTNVRNGRVDVSENRFVDEPTFNKWTRRARPRRGDIILSREAPLGEVGLLRSDARVFLGQRTMLYRANPKILDQHFLYYQMMGPYVQAVIHGQGSGSTVAHLRVPDAETLPIPVAPKKAQRNIAAILSSYDELIENNKRRIALLEKLAEEIYREWFVRLRFPGHEEVRLIKGVPDGWGLKRFHEIVEYYIGGGWGEATQSTSFSDGAFVIRGTDIPDVQAGEFDGCPFRYHKPSNLKSRLLQPNDFVFEVSGGSKDQLLGRNVLVTERVLNFFNKAVIAASFCKQIRFNSELVSPYFMKYFMKLYYDYDLVGIYQVQSTGISNYQFESFLKFQTIILPSDELQKQFDDKVKPIIDMRDEVALANIVLRKTRDVLLPRLISGKLSVEDLDIQFPPSMTEELNSELTTCSTNA